jgi:hypothetical protein
MKSLLELDFTDWLLITSYQTIRNYTCVTDLAKRGTIHNYRLFTRDYSSRVKNITVIHDKMACKRTSRQLRAFRKSTGHNYSKGHKPPKCLERITDPELTLSLLNRLLRRIEFETGNLRVLLHVMN